MRTPSARAVSGPEAEVPVATTVREPTPTTSEAARPPRGRRLLLAAAKGALTGVGAAYGVAAALRPALAGPATGVAAGLAVWAGSYLGWLPAAGLHPSPGRDRPGRPAAMVASHAAFGAALGAGVRAVGR